MRAKRTSGRLQNLARSRARPFAHAAIVLLSGLTCLPYSRAAGAEDLPATSLAPDPLFREILETSAAGDRLVVEGSEGWLFFLPELRHLAAGPFWGAAAAEAGRAARADARDPLPAILAFHGELRQRGVRLLLVPVPPKSVVRLDRLPGAEGRDTQERPDPAHPAFYDLLREKGVDVLDLTGLFTSAGEPERGPLYCRQDTHWSGVGCVYAARAIAEQVRPWLPDHEPAPLSAAWSAIGIDGDLRRMLDDPERPKETLQVRTVEGAKPDPRSPLLLLGDSHALVFQSGGDMHARDAGLAAQLAYELGIPVELIAVRGSGATPARINLFRRARAEPGYWDAKQVVVWVFAAREFTESDGWRIVPIAP